MSRAGDGKVDGNRTAAKQREKSSSIVAEGEEGDVQA